MMLRTQPVQALRNYVCREMAGTIRTSYPSRSASTIPSASTSSHSSSISRIEGSGDGSPICASPNQLVAAPMIVGLAQLQPIPPGIPPNPSFLSGLCFPSQGSHASQPQSTVVNTNHDLVHDHVHDHALSVQNCSPFPTRPDQQLVAHTGPSRPWVGGVVHVDRCQFTDNFEQDSLNRPVSLKACPVWGSKKGDQPLGEALIKIFHEAQAVSALKKSLRYQLTRYNMTTFQLVGSERSVKILGNAIL
jgi:hypothetical protein